MTSGCLSPRSLFPTGQRFWARHPLSNPRAAVALPVSNHENQSEASLGAIWAPFTTDLHLTRSKRNQDFSPLFVKRLSCLFEETVGRYAKSNCWIKRNRKLRECFFYNRPNNSSSRLWEQNSLFKEQRIGFWKRPVSLASFVLVIRYLELSPTSAFRDCSSYQDSCSTLVRPFDTHYNLSNDNRHITKTTTTTSKNKQTNKTKNIPRVFKHIFSHSKSIVEGPQ